MGGGYATVCVFQANRPVDLTPPRHEPVQIAGIIYLVAVPGFERAFVSGTFQNRLLENAPLVIVTVSIHSDGRVTDDYLSLVREKFPGFYHGDHIGGSIEPELVWKVVTNLLSSPPPPVYASNIFRDRRKPSWFDSIWRLFRSVLSFTTVPTRLCSSSEPSPLNRRD